MLTLQDVETARIRGCSARVTMSVEGHSGVVLTQLTKPCGLSAVMLGLLRRDGEDLSAVAACEQHHQDVRDGRVPVLQDHERIEFVWWRLNEVEQQLHHEDHHQMATYRAGLHARMWERMMGSGG